MDSCQLNQLVFIIHRSSSPARRKDREHEPTVHYSYLRKPLAAFSAGNLPGCERLDIFGFIVMAAALLPCDISCHLNKDQVSMNLPDNLQMCDVCKLQILKKQKTNPQVMFFTCDYSKSTRPDRFTPTGCVRE